MRITDLAGKAVLITGASTGIGAAVAKGFATQGARVAVHYNSSEAHALQVLEVDLSRIYAAPITRLGCLAFEGQGALAPQS